MPLYSCTASVFSPVPPVRVAFTTGTDVPEMFAAYQISSFTDPLVRPAAWEYVLLLLSETLIVGTAPSAFTATTTAMKFPVTVALVNVALITANPVPAALLDCCLIQAAEIDEVYGRT